MLPFYKTSDLKDPLLEGEISEEIYKLQKGL